MPQETSRQGSSHTMLGSSKPQSNTCISGLAPAVKPDSSPIESVKPVELVNFHPCIQPPQRITTYILDSDEDTVMSAESEEK